MRSYLASFLSIAVLVCSPQFARALDQQCVKKIDSRVELGCQETGARWLLEVATDPRFPSKELQDMEHFVLRVYAQRSNEVFAQANFEASYGAFEVCAMCAGKTQANPIIFQITDHNHGTNVRRGKLVTYSIAEMSLEPILAVPVFGFFGYGTWQYRREFVDLNGDGVLDLRLVLEHDPIASSPANNLALLPANQVVEYLFDVRRNAYEPVRIQTH